MVNAAQVSIALSLVMTSAVVHLVARVWNERRLFFVHLGREMTDADRARARRVVAINATSCAVGVVAVLVTTADWVLVGTAIVLPFVPIAALLVEVASLLRTLPATRVPGRYTVPLTEQPSSTSYLSAPLQAAHVAVVVVTSALFVLLLDKLPAQVPMHWNTRGQVNRWGSPSELWVFLSWMLFDLVLMWLVAWSVAKERWALPPENAEAYKSLQRKRRAMIVRLTEWLMLFVNLSSAIMWLAIAANGLPGMEGLADAGVWSGIAVMAVGIVAVLAIYLRPLIAVQDELTAIAGTDVLGTRPDGWKWGGTIYYAPDDPAVFVPKKLGIGQTLNMASPWSWIFLVGIIVVPMALTFLIIALAD